MKLLDVAQWLSPEYLDWRPILSSQHCPYSKRVLAITASGATSPWHHNVSSRFIPTWLPVSFIDNVVNNQSSHILRRPIIISFGSFHHLPGREALGEGLECKVLVVPCCYTTTASTDQKKTTATIDHIHHFQAPAVIITGDLSLKSMT